MPFVSQAQRKYMFAKHPKIAQEFASKTPKGAKLPEHVSSKKVTKKKGIIQMYQDATKGLQNYGANIAKNVAKNSADFKANQGTKGYNNYQTKNPFPNPLKASSYKQKKVPKVKVDNKMKGSYGETEIVNGKAKSIKINVKAHKGDKAELADTIHHETMHAKHPKMTEKMVRKNTAKDMKKMSPSDKKKILKKMENYKQGAFKGRLTKYKTEKSAPGALITRLRNK